MLTPHCLLLLLLLLFLPLRKQLLLGRENYGFEVDVWSAGCVMGEMMENSVIFLGESRMDQIAQIINILGTRTMEGWS